MPLNRQTDRQRGGRGGRGAGGTRGKSYATGFNYEMLVGVSRFQDCASLRCYRRRRQFLFSAPHRQGEREREREREYTQPFYAAGFNYETLFGIVRFKDYASLRYYMCRRQFLFQCTYPHPQLREKEYTQPFFKLMGSITKRFSE